MQHAAYIVIMYTGDGKLQVDVSSAPTSPRELVGAAKSLADIVDLLPQVGKLLNQILAKYKLGR